MRRVLSSVMLLIWAALIFFGITQLLKKPGKDQPVKLTFRSAPSLKQVPLPDGSGVLEIRLVTGPNYLDWYFPAESKKALFEAEKNFKKIEDFEAFHAEVLRIFKAIPQMDVRYIKLVTHPVNPGGGSKNVAPAIFSFL